MRSLFFLSAFISLPTLACPNLTGVYKICHSLSNQNTISQVTVVQKIVNKFNQYTITTQEAQVDNVRVEKFVADGKVKTVADTDPDTGIILKTETVTTCQNDVLNIQMDATLDSESFANITIKASKNGKQMIQVISGVSMGEPISDSIICE